MGITPDETGVKAIAELADRANNPSVISVNALPDFAAGERLLVARNSYHSVDDITDKVIKTLPHPIAYTGDLKIKSVQSLIDITNRYKADSSVLFADPDALSVVTVFDYHDALDGLEEPESEWEFASAPAESETAEADETKKDETEKFDPVEMLSSLGGLISRLEMMGGGPRPNWARFRAAFAFPKSRAYKAWESKNTVRLGQADFANFIEDNALDIYDPAMLTNDPKHPQWEIDERIRHNCALLGIKLGSPSAMLQVSRGMSLHSEEQVKSAVNLSTGETQVIYEQKHDDSKREMTVPSGFLLSLRVFEGGAKYKLLVRLRYRKSSGSIAWFYEVFQLEAAFEDAFKDECATISSATELPLFYGVAPPAG